jgi:hypothetical protein
VTKSVWQISHLSAKASSPVSRFPPKQNRYYRGIDRHAPKRPASPLPSQRESLLRQLRSIRRFFRTEYSRRRIVKTVARCAKSDHFTEDAYMTFKRYRSMGPTCHKIGEGSRIASDGGTPWSTRSRSGKDWCKSAPGTAAGRSASGGSTEGRGRRSMRSSPSQKPATGWPSARCLIFSSRSSPPRMSAVGPVSVLRRWRRQSSSSRRASASSRSRALAGPFSSHDRP